MANFLKTLTVTTLMVSLLAGCNPCDDSHHWVGEDGQCEMNDVGNSPSPSGSSGVAPAGPATISASQLSPAANATGVDVGTQISLQISEPLTDVSSCMNCQINGLQFVVTASNDPTATPLAGSIQVSGQNIAFVPNSPLNLAEQYTVNFSLANANVVVTSMSWSFTTETVAPNPLQALSATNQTLETLSLAFYQKLTPSDTSVVLWQVVSLPSGAGSFLTPDPNYSATFNVGQQSTSTSLSNDNEVTYVVNQDPNSLALSVDQQTGHNFGLWDFADNTSQSMGVTITMNGNQILPSRSILAGQLLTLSSPSLTSFFAALVPAGSLPGNMMDESQLLTEVPIGVGQAAIITGSTQTGYALTAQ